MDFKMNSRNETNKFVASSCELSKLFPVIEKPSHVEAMTLREFRVDVKDFKLV